MTIRNLISIAAMASVTLFAQAPKFEAADVHRSAMNPYTFVSGGVLRGERYDLRKATVLDLIQIAYNVDPDVVLGGPNWLEFDQFDIAAKAPAGTSPATIRLMLQSLLTDRFHLVLHQDSRPIPAFALVVSKGKPKLTEAMGDGNAGCEYQPQPAASTFTAVACRKMTMQAFAEWLRGAAGDYLASPVADATRIDGSWDFDLKWHGRARSLPGGVERVTIFKAVERQLGLSLAPQNAPAPVLVIDSVNERPTENVPDIAKKLPRRDIEFEVADLKPSSPGEPGAGMRVTPGGGFEARAVDMRILLGAAWDMDWSHINERFAPLPKWVSSARFDINAKASTNTNSPPVRGWGYMDDDVRLMLRALLIDRFKIKYELENRPVTAYSLAPGKVKMKPGNPAVRASCKTARTIANDPRDLNPRLAELLDCRNVTMAEFAAALQPLAPNNFAYPVEDATGLGGRWDFMLSYTPAWMLTAPAPQTAAIGDSTAASDPGGGISLAEAISKQLGLKLEMRKRMLPVVVIDHIEEKPTPN
ncbi:MAG: TIGR03435 family protein [Bryobacteraceae bacterium]